MKEKKFPELKYDLLYKTASKLIKITGEDQGEFFDNVTKSLGMARAWDEACVTWQCLVDNASCKETKMCRAKELKETQACYNDSLKAVYNVICENGGKDIYNDLLQEQQSQQQ